MAHDASPLICILVGQSDMVGRGEPKKLADDLVDAVANNAHGHRIVLLYEIDRLGKEGEPSDSDGTFRQLNRTAQYSNAGRCHSFGPEWGIAEALLQSRHLRDGRRRDIYFIKFAAGSTNLHEDWNPSGELFAGMVALVREGVRQIAEDRTSNAAGNPGTSRAQEGTGRTESAKTTSSSIKQEQEQRRLLRDDTVFFWLQGHSDAGGNAAMRNSYEENFLRFVPAVREELLGEGRDPSEGRVDDEVINGRDGRPSSLNLPIVASQLDWPVNENSKSSIRYAKRLRAINDALRDACAKLSAAEGDRAAAEAGPVPCIFADFPEESDRFALSHHPDGHCDNDGLLSLGRNMARCFRAGFLGDA